jgi:hypothetical protein
MRCGHLPDTATPRVPDRHDFPRRDCARGPRPTKCTCWFYRPDHDHCSWWCSVMAADRVIRWTTAGAVIGVAAMASYEHPYALVRAHGEAGLAGRPVSLTTDGLTYATSIVMPGFVGHFAADVDPVRARVMWAVQQPLSASALQEVMGVPVWKSRPSWFLVAAGESGHPARSRAPVRRPHGRHHRRGAVEPRRDSLPPAGRAGPPPDRRSGRAGLGRPRGVTPRPVRNNDLY